MLFLGIYRYDDSGQHCPSDIEYVTDVTLKTIPSFDQLMMLCSWRVLEKMCQLTQATTCVFVFCFCFYIDVLLLSFKITRIDAFHLSNADDMSVGRRPSDSLKRSPNQPTNKTLI
jgi:hypothetical protein